MQITIRFALFELVRELLEIRPGERRSSNFCPVSAGFSVLEQRVPMNPSFLTACVAACLRDRSRPRIALAKCSPSARETTSTDRLPRPRTRSPRRHQACFGTFAAIHSRSATEYPAASSSTTARRPESRAISDNGVAAQI